MHHVRALLVVLLLIPLGASAASLRFRGHGGSAGDSFAFPDRVKVPMLPASAANVGAGDFTVELWLRASAAENPNPARTCGPGVAWIEGNILIDRDRFGQRRKYGVSLLGGRIAFGVSSDTGEHTLCGQRDVRDLAWHHVAVQRRASDGMMWIWIDGALDASGPPADGPASDVSYPAGAAPASSCSPDGGSGFSSCESSDPFLVFGAEKHGYDGINFSGWLDEIRLSRSLRYSAAFTRPPAAFAPDADTAALWHFDEAQGSVTADASGGGSTGQIFFGGAAPAGPEWSSESPFPAAAAIPALDRFGALLLTGSLAAAGVLKRRARAARFPVGDDPRHAR
jgi:hypothetical protein